MFLSLFWSCNFCEQICKDFGPENDIPYWKPFLLAGTKREPIKQSLWEKQDVPLVGKNRKSATSGELSHVCLWLLWDISGRKHAGELAPTTARMGMQCQSWSGITWVGRQTRCAMCRHYTNVFIPHGGSKVYHFLFFFSSAPLQVDLMASKGNQASHQHLIR